METIGLPLKPVTLVELLGNLDMPKSCFHFGSEDSSVVSLKENLKLDLTGGKHENSFYDNASVRGCSPSFLELLQYRANRFQCRNSSCGDARNCSAATYSKNSGTGCLRPHRSLYRVPEATAPDFCRPG